MSEHGPGFVYDTMPPTTICVCGEIWPCKYTDEGKKILRDEAIGVFTDRLES